MAWWKDEIMDPIAQEHFGWDDIEFTFHGRGTDRPAQGRPNPEGLLCVDGGTF